jgi:hypothetical protein
VSDLAVSQLPGDSGAAGTIAIAIQVKNTSSHKCTVKGYPAFTLSDHEGSSDTDEPVQLSHGAYVTGAFGAPVKTITVSPGGHSGFVLAYSQVPTGSSPCATTHRMHLSLPGSGATTTGDVTIDVCGSPIQISPYVTPNKLTP